MTDIGKVITAFEAKSHHLLEEARAFNTETIATLHALAEAEVAQSTQMGRIEAKLDRLLGDTHSPDESVP